MKFELPKASDHPLIQVVCESPKGDQNAVLQADHKFVEFDLPAGVVEDDCQVTAYFCDSNCRVDERTTPVVLKSRVEKRGGMVQAAKPKDIKVEPKVEPKAEIKEPAKVEPAVEPKVEPKFVTGVSVASEPATEK